MVRAIRSLRRVFHQNHFLIPCFLLRQLFHSFYEPVWDYHNHCYSGHWQGGGGVTAEFFPMLNSPKPWKLRGHRCVSSLGQRFYISGIHSNYCFFQRRAPSTVTGTVLPIKQKNTSPKGAGSLEVAITISQLKCPEWHTGHPGRWYPVRILKWMPELTERGGTVTERWLAKSTSCSLIHLANSFNSCLRLHVQSAVLSLYLQPSLSTRLQGT